MTASTGTAGVAVYPYRQTEGEFQRALLELAHTLGARPYHPLRSTGSEPGWPDLALALPPTLHLWELKTEAGRLTRAQTAWLEALGACTAIDARVVRPSDWPFIAETLRAWRMRR